MTIYASMLRRTLLVMAVLALLGVGLLQAQAQDGLSSEVITPENADQLTELARTELDSFGVTLSARTFEADSAGIVTVTTHDGTTLYDQAAPERQLGAVGQADTETLYAEPSFNGTQLVTVERNQENFSVAIYVYDIETLELTIEPIPIEDLAGPISGYALWPRGNVLALSVDQFGIRIYDLDEGALLTTWDGFQGAPGSLAFDPSGQHLAVVDRDNQVLVLEAGFFEDDEPLSSFEVVDAYFGTTFAWQPTSDQAPSTVLAVATTNAVSLWDVETGEVVTMFEIVVTGDDDMPTALAFSPDGALLAIGTGTTHSGGDSSMDISFSVQVWTIDSALLTTLEGHDFTVNGLAFNADGTLLNSIGGEAWIVWGIPADGETGDEVQD